MEQKQQLQQVQKECLTLTNGSIVDNEIAQCFMGDKLNLVSPIILKQTLAYIFTLIGLTRLPDENEYAIIEDFIRTSFPQFTIQEFRVAFKLATQGKLECNVDHYEKFSAKFISQVMNAYKYKANQVRRQIQINKELPVPKLTDDEIVEFSKNEWLTGKRKDFNRVFNVNKVFNILLKQKKLQIDNKKKLEIINFVNLDNADRLAKMLPIDAKEFNKKIKDEDFIEHQCKALALVFYYDMAN